MKLFFMFPPRGIKSSGNSYEQIMARVKKLGYKAASNLNFLSKHDNRITSGNFVEYYNVLDKEIRGASGLVVELSFPSSSIGYLISSAINIGKPVVILIANDNDYDIFHAIEKESDKLKVIRHSGNNDLDIKLREAHDFIKEAQDVRFNFFISPKHSAYLDWIAKTKKIPRAVHLRNLINKHMKNNS